MIDIEATDFGRIVIVHATSARGSAWLRSHVERSKKAPNMADLIEEALEDGLDVRPVRI